MNPIQRWMSVAAFAMGTVSVVVAPALAQVAAPDPDPGGELRVGVSIGGTGFLSLVTEYRRGDWSGELTVGTISFRELSVAVAGKRYFSGGQLRPAVGLGFWSLNAWSEGERGSVFVLRAPLALDWTTTGGHGLGLEVHVNHALAVKRMDPEDDTPARGGIIPIPAAYYRYGWNP